MSSGSSGNSREVTISLRAGVHKDTAGAFKSVAKMAKDAESQQVASASRAASVAEREAKRREKAEIAAELRTFRARQKTIKDREREEARAAREAERLAQKAEREAIARDRKLFLSRQKAIKDREREEVRAAKAQESAYRKAEAVVEQSQSKVRAATAASAEGFKMAIGGATALARGFALVGAANEESMEKAVKTLAKVEAGVQAIRGTIDLVQGGVKVWRAYTAAVEAAAAAHAAVGAAQAIAGGAGAAGSAGRGAGGLAANVATGYAGAKLAGTGKAATGAASATGAGGIGVAMTAGAIVAAGAGIVAALKAAGDNIRDASKYGAGGGATPGSWNERVAGWASGFNTWVAGATGMGPQVYKDSAAEDAQTARMEADRQKQTEFRSARDSYWQERLAIEAKGRKEPTTAAEGQAALDEARQRYRSASTTADAPESLVSGRHQEYISALEKAVQLRKEEAEQQQRINREQMQGAKERIAALEQEKQKHLDIAKQIRERTKSAKESFGALSSQDQSRLINLKKRMDQGGELSREDEALLEQYGDDRAKDEINKRRRQRAEAAGFGSFYGEDRKEQEARRQEDLAGQIDVTIKDNREVVVRLEADNQRIARDVAAQAKPLMEEQRRELAEMVRRELEAMERRLTQQGHSVGAFNRGAAGSGV